VDSGVDIMHSKMTFVPRKGRVVGIQVSEPIEVFMWDGQRESYHTVLSPGRGKKIHRSNFIEWNSVRIATQNITNGELKLRKPQVIK
jgi:hypothetical protein